MYVSGSNEFKSDWICVPHLVQFKESSLYGSLNFCTERLSHHFLQFAQSQDGRTAAIYASTEILQGNTIVQIPTTLYNQSSCYMII